MNELQPLNSGIILIVGIKPGNLDTEIQNHPRVIIWDSQNERWTSKEFPSNTRAVFITRFISHSAFDKIIKEARKKRITIFNPEGTGLIKKQVRELLSMNPLKEIAVPTIQSNQSENSSQSGSIQSKRNQYGKLNPLIPFIDLNLSRATNARNLLVKANELSITTTFNSLVEFVGKQYRKASSGNSVRPNQISSGSQTQDVSVQMFDNLIKELKDMREFFIETVKENQSLKARLDKFKRLIND